MSAAKRFFSHPNLVLPNLPGVAAQLLAGFDDDDMTLAGLAELIGKDPALSAKVLRVANSARYSPLRSVASLRDATAMLGMTTLRKLTIATCVSGSFGVIKGLDLPRFWRHGIATAHLATELARVSGIDAETAYLGGLMLRTGQLLMLQVDPAGVAELEKAVHVPGQRFSLEYVRWDCAHSDVTAELARRWQFPDSLLLGFQSAGRPLEGERFSVLGGVLHLAEVLADAIDLGLPPIDTVMTHQGDLVGRLRLKTSWLADRLPDPAGLAEEARLMTGG
ncbi:HDOD domain-containing protein [Piscinibacter sakaiensis]|uniref:HD domain protein n=1 Tax=Piscinibacter sakaiensis TaxID=1547922 RepID=A0A0K8P6C6_PISS1|nr:HDOD domain-containing protein [Piscinibacter sakaiensis]GAP38089.1 HD domain protein [Piscinibacter sakaiensis]